MSAVIALALGGATPPAMAQSSSMSMMLFNGEDLFRPDLSRRDIAIMVRVLGLGSDEQDAINELYAGYAAALALEGGAVRSYCARVIEEAEVMEDIRLLAPAQERMAAWRKQSETLKQQFMSDLRSLLTREQEGRWPVVERELRRIKQLPASRLSAEGVDLAAMLEDSSTEAAKSPAIAELVNRYIEELDRAPVAREAFLEGAKPEFEEALKDNPARAEELWVEANDKRLAVREINVRYERLISAQLPADQAENFSRAVFEASYDTLTKSTRLEKAIRAGPKLPTLTADQAALVRAEADRFERERQAWLQGAAAALREHELSTRPEQLDKAMGKPIAENNDQWNGGSFPPDHPLREARRARFKMEREAKDRIDALLTADQRAQLPDHESGVAHFVDWTPWGL